MAAAKPEVLITLILNLRLPVTLNYIRYSAIELLDAENRGLAVGTALLSCLEASGLETANSKYRLPVTSGTISNSAIGLLDPKMGVCLWNGVAILSRS